ncbi:portal protein [Corallococcus sp. H22C18031201]|nr:portal protein [Corallococcus sp. H22C18031201]
MPSLFQRAMKALGFIGTGVKRIAYSLPLWSYGPRRGAREVLVAYREDDWLRTVVDTVANSVATPRWRVYKRRIGAEKRADPRWKSLDGKQRRKAIDEAVAEGELVELEHHELLSILDSPHPIHPGREYRKLAQIHIDLVGEAFMILLRSEGGRIVGWELVPPHCVTMTPQGERRTFFISYGRVSGFVPEAEVLWAKHLDPEDPDGRGTGRGMALGDKLDAIEAIDKSTKATFERGGIPLAVLGLSSKSTDDGYTTKEAADDLEKRFEQAHRGPKSAGKTWVAPTGVTLAQVQVNYRELQTKEIAKDLRANVREAYLVPPELVGDVSNSNRATSEAAKYHLAEYATAPALEFWRAFFQHRLVPLVDRDAILEYEDPRPQEWERTFRVMTTPAAEHVRFNEYRAFGGLPSLPELDGKRPGAMPGAGAGGNNVASAAANATPMPPRDRTGEEDRV